jgi:hypothetical protein
LCTPSIPTESNHPSNRRTPFNHKNPTAQRTKAL